jgi:murein L,D-transpeptidase YcbB/YkuD
MFGQNLTNNARSVMRNLAISSGIWNYVEPASDTPTWVHFDERQVASGYPLLRRGSKGAYVCVLQDALTTLGYNTGGLDGIFGSNTYNSVLNFQKTRGLSVDGLVGNNTWRTLMAEVVGKGASSTTVN